MEQPITELRTMKWTSVMSGWKRRYLRLYRNALSVLKSKKSSKHKNNVIVFPLSKIRIVHEKKNNHFIIHYDKKKMCFKVEREEETEKQVFLDKVNRAIEESRGGVMMTETASLEGEEVVEIKKGNVKKMEKALEMVNEYMVSLQVMEKGVKKGFRSSFSEIVLNVIQMVRSIKRIFENGTISATASPIKKPIQHNENDNIMNSNVIQLTKKSESLKQNAKTSHMNDDAHIDNDNDNDDDDDSIIDQLDDSSSSSSSETEDDNNIIIDDMKSVCQIITESKRSLKTFKRSLSQQLSDFYDIHYDTAPRTSLPCTLSLSSSFLKDSLKAFTSKKSSFPIHYNEPLSMLQKQCEKFIFIPHLFAASSSPSHEHRLLNIISFLCGELSQNINRFLKPMNPILGETFEFFDNTLKYRFFSEQVSHVPPISAYICESNDFVFYGDTRCKTSFKLLKGAMELQFTNKTYIYFKHCDEKYAITRPKVRMQGLLSGMPRYECEGLMEIACVKNGNARAEIWFREAKKNEVSVEGKIEKEGKVVYKVSGSWRDVVYYVDAEGKKKELWRIAKEEYLENGFEKYVMPAYAVRFNYVDDSFKQVLPITDSRRRPDQREYENGNVDKASDIKKNIENRQRKRHEYFEENKITYEPKYFKNVYDESADDYVYVYKGGYFEQRAKGVFDNEEDIFGIKE